MNDKSDPRKKPSSSSRVRPTKTVFVMVRMTEEERDALRAKAREAEVSVPEYLRRCASDRKIASAVDAQTVRELRRLGGLQKHLFNAGGGVKSKEYAAILGEIREAISRIMNAA